MPRERVTITACCSMCAQQVWLVFQDWSPDDPETEEIEGCWECPTCETTQLIGVVGEVVSVISIDGPYGHR
jgi:hypothetical protein